MFLDADERRVATWDPGEFFIDNNNNGVFDAAGNGVWDDQILISDQGSVVFSGRPVITIDPTMFALTEGMPTQCFTVTIADENGNPLVGGTKVTFTTTGAVTAIPGSVTIPDTGGTGGEDVTVFEVCLARSIGVQPSPAPSPAPAPGPASLTVEVEGGDTGGTSCPGSNGSAKETILGTVQ